MKKLEELIGNKVGEMASKFDSRFDDIEEILKMVLVANVALASEATSASNDLCGEDKAVEQIFNIMSEDDKVYMDYFGIKHVKNIFLNKIQYKLIAFTKNNNSVNIRQIRRILSIMGEQDEEIILVFEKLNARTRSSMIKNEINFMIKETEVRIITRRK